MHPFQALSSSSRVMISRQTIYMCSPGIPQTGIRINSNVQVVSASRRRAPQGGRLKRLNCFPSDRDSSTLAIKQGLASSTSFFSSAPVDALKLATVEVPAKDTGTKSDVTGTNLKTVELVDPKFPAQIPVQLEDQLPPLLSLIVDGLPPLEQSAFVHEAELPLRQYIDQYPTVSSLASYCSAGLAAASYAHPGVISLDRIVAMSITYAILFVLDDIFFDMREDFLLEQYGVSRDLLRSLESIEEYINYLGAVLGQQVQPRRGAPLIETMVSELGQIMMERSNPEWFRTWIEYFLDCQRACIASEADIVQGRTLYFQDLESYTVMRAANVAGKLTQVMIEFAFDSYIPGILRVDPYFEKLTTACSIHIGFINDVFSYHRESTKELNPRNLISVLMEVEGMPFVPAARKAIDLTNQYAREVVDMEAEASSSTLRNYLVGIKAVMAGNAYFCLMFKRYHHPDSAFPELRDMDTDWKIVPLNAKLKVEGSS